MKDCNSFPLKILIIGEHHHSTGHKTLISRQIIKNNNRILAYGSIDDYDKAYSLIFENDINVILLDPIANLYGIKEPYNFLKKIKKEFPFIRIVFFVHFIDFLKIVKKNIKYAHYFRIPTPNDSERIEYELITNKYKQTFDNVLAKCQQSLYEMFNFDIAISFAGEDRKIAREFSDNLTRLGNRVFFDEFYESDLLGKDLYTYLSKIYYREARYCIVLISKNYKIKKWAAHERKSAQSRDLENYTSDYILPIRLDETKISGLLSSIGYMDISEGIDKISRIISNKIWLPSEPKKKNIICPNFDNQDDTIQDF